MIRQELFESLQAYKLEPAPTDTPYKLETGTQNHEGIAGLIGTIQFIESLGEGKTRSERLVSGIQKIDDYETNLADDLEDFLRNLSGIKLFRAPANMKKTPTFAFIVEGKNSRDVTRWFYDNYKMCVADGDFYASTMAEKLNVYPSGGWVRIGLTPYNTHEEIQLFKKGLSVFSTKLVSSVPVISH